jgi:hypothetical protein
MKAKIIDMAWDKVVDGEHFLQWCDPCLIHAGNYTADIVYLVKKVLAYGEYFVVTAQTLHGTSSIIAYLNRQWLNHYHRAMGTAQGLARY